MLSTTAGPSTFEHLRARAADVARVVLSADCEEIDREGAWPERGLRALAEAGLMGLHIPEHLGGHGQGMLALATIAEELGQHCSSTAMCFGMHCVASKVLSARATPYHEDKFLRPIAEGRHISSLSLSEPGTGVHFFLPRAQFRNEESAVVLSGQKSFVTSGSHADSYVMSAVVPGQELDPGAFACFAVAGDAPGLEWQNEWQGFGMRGNSSRSVLLNDVRIPRENLLGAEGDEIWYVFEVIAPYFIIAMAGVYLGIAQAALDAALTHLKTRRHDHTGQAISEVSTLADQAAEMWIAVQRTRQLIHHAARLGDAGESSAALALFASKADVADMVTSVTQQAMILSGGRGYEQNSQIARLMRDAQASHVMSPTTHLLKTWLGRSLLDLPLL